MFINASVYLNFMDLIHSIGHFKNSSGKIEVIKFYDDEESLATALKLSINAKTSSVNNDLLKELKWPQYREKLIRANTLLVKQHISESVNTDTHIIQSINAVEELDKICNTLVKRVREWYGYYYPELGHLTPDNETFIKKVLQKSKSEYMMENQEQVSMGPEIDQKDLDMILGFARQVDDMYTEREKLITYIDNTMMSYCPNVYSITGAMIGAKLIEKAKSLRHLAMLPSSTVQLFGAEKALFRHLRNKRIRPPKHGLILSHPFIMDAKRSEKGAFAKAFAAKISIAAKVDYFKGDFVGDKLLDDLRKYKEHKRK